MKIGFTEFSYGYAFVENLIRSSGGVPSIAPVFPNLVQEASLGYDVQLNLPAAPIFFQFKLPDLMKRKSAKEVSTFNCYGLEVPFFRCSLMRRDISRQHQLLIELEATHPNGVFYAAPELQSLMTFNSAYNLGRVAQESAFFSPSAIGPLADDMQHTIAYKKGLTAAYFCSKPKELHKMSYATFSDQTAARFDDQRYANIGVMSQELLKELVSRSSPSMQRHIGSARKRITSRLRDRVSGRAGRTLVNLLLATEIARIDFGVQLLIAQPSR